MNKRTKELIKKLKEENIALTIKCNNLLNESKPNLLLENDYERRNNILNREAKLTLLEESMSIKAKTIFQSDSKNPLELLPFTNWVESLSRKDLVGGLETFETTFKVFDEMTLSQIKAYYHDALLMFYDKKKKQHLDTCTYLLNNSKK